MSTDVLTPLTGEDDDMADEPAAIAAGVAEAYRQERAIWVVDHAGWASHEAANPENDVHVFCLPGTVRTLLRGETGWWCRGLSAGWGAPDLVADVWTEPVPEVVSNAEACELVPSLGDRTGSLRSETTSPDGLDYMVREGDLGPGLYGLRRRRYLFLAQVSAEVLRRQLRIAEHDGAAPRSLLRAGKIAQGAAARWAELAELLPSPVPRPEQVDGIEPKPSPDPLPVVGADGPKRARQALLRAHQLGLLVYRGSKQPVTVQGAELNLTGVGPVQVLAWVLGVADAAGRGAEVAYRDGLG